MPGAYRVTDYFDTADKKRQSIFTKLKAAEKSLSSILQVVLEEWKLEIGAATFRVRSSNSSNQDLNLAPEAFEKLPIAEAGPGVMTKLAAIGVKVIEHHVSLLADGPGSGVEQTRDTTVHIERDPDEEQHAEWHLELTRDAVTGRAVVAKDPKPWTPCCNKLWKGDIIMSVNNEDGLVDAQQIQAAIKDEVDVEFGIRVSAGWFTLNATPPSLVEFVEIYYVARNELVNALVPAILADVELYDAEAKKQAALAGKQVLARLAAIAENPGDPLTKEEIAALTTAHHDGDANADAAPGSKTLARLSYDQHIASGGSITLYKRISKTVADVKDQLSTPGIVLPGNVKGKERTIYKSGLKYNGDTTKCHDKIRCTVKLETLGDIATVGEGLIKMPDFLVVKVKNRFDPEYDALPIGGYRDMQFSGLIELSNGGTTSSTYAWCEVQLNLSRMIALKSGKAEGQAAGEKAGHDAFNLARAINAFAPESFVHEGEWSSDVAKQASAGLLLEVNLNGTGFEDDEQRTEFVKALNSKQCRVRQLGMTKMRLGEEGGAAVGMVLATNTSVTSLNLHQNGLGEVGGTAIAEALKVNTALEFINLGANELGEVGGAAFAEVLKVNKVLTSINLRMNSLGGEKIAEALKVNTVLTSVNLSMNELNEVGGAAIASALESNTTLLEVDVSRNFMPDAVEAAIEAAVEKNNLDAP